MRLREARCAIDKSENSYAINRGRERVVPASFLYLWPAKMQPVARGWRLEKRRRDIEDRQQRLRRRQCQARRLPTFLMHRYEYK